VPTAPEAHRSFHLPEAFRSADAWLGMAAWPGLEVVGHSTPRTGDAGMPPRRGPSIADAFDLLDAAEMFSVILPENERSQGVARRLGLALVDERVLATFQSRPMASGGSDGTNGRGSTGEPGAEGGDRCQRR
jgi:hypothetical protein